jgi:hypothetical protein
VISSWYFGSSQPLYFDMSYASKLHRFEITIKPDLSDASLHFINTSKHTCEFYSLSCRQYTICEDRLLFWEDCNDEYGPHLRLLSSHFANVISPVQKNIYESDDGFSLCPASGRSIYFDRNDIVIGDYSDTYSHFHIDRPRC